MRFRPADSDADNVLAEGQAALDPDELRVLGSRAGPRLTAQFFGDKTVVDNFDRARTAAESAGAGLRVRLFVDPAAPELHGVVWELLGDPRRSPAWVPLGHVDRAWSHSFQWGRAADQLDIYHSVLAQLMAGVPVGGALEVFNQLYASIATMLDNVLEDVKFGATPNDAELAGLWTAANDARNFVLLGDPAARLNFGGRRPGPRPHDRPREAPGPKA
jgi:hypothetical protein